MSSASPAVAPESVVNSSDVAADADIIESDVLVEEVSIDGMCGVY